MIAILRSPAGWGTQVSATTTTLIASPCRVAVAAEPAISMAAAGPAILEEPYFTSHVPAGWRFEISAARDILLYREGD